MARESLRLKQSDSPVPDRSTPEHTAYVSLSRYTDVQKQQYTEMPKTGKNIYKKLDEVVGKHSDDEGNVFYFARYQEGIVERYPASDFQKKFPALVNEFKRRKARGDLPPFDPTSSEVHPRSRLHVNLRLSATRGSRSSVSSRSGYEDDEDEDMDDGTESVPNSASESEELLNEFDEEFGRSSRSRTRRKTKQSKLPFSPRKTRSRVVHPVPDSDEEDEDEDEDGTIQTRRSSRSKPIKVTLKLDQSYTEDDDSEEEEENEMDEDEDDSDAYGQTSSKSKAKKGKKRQAHKRKARPAFGVFQPVINLPNNAASDNEEETIARHRHICEKCQRGPAHTLIKAARKRKGKKRKRAGSEDFESSGDEAEKVTQLGGWVRCLKCPVVAHWKCLGVSQKDDILKAAREKDRAKWLAEQDHEEGAPEPDVERNGPRKRPGLTMDEMTDFLCGSCMKGSVCLGCLESAVDPALPSPSAEGEEEQAPEAESEHVFRCLTCKRACHYEHLATPKALDEDAELVEIAQYYQKNWLCMDCASLHYTAEKIIAWRPYPPNAVETSSSKEPPHYKSQLPREYLIKWKDRSYRRTTWVPHMWLLSMQPGLLRVFIQQGSKVELVPGLTGEEITARAQDLNASALSGIVEAMPNAETLIPERWKTIDRLLDIRLWSPPRHKKQPQGKGKGKKRIETDSGEDDEWDEAYEDIFASGEQPNDSYLQTIEEWEWKKGQKFTKVDIGLIVWVFVKWDDLGYEEATWDSPPQEGHSSYPAFERALTRYLDARKVTVPLRKPADVATFEDRPHGAYRKHYKLEKAEDLDLGQDPGLKLMDFQVDGFNWLCDNWWNKQPCILADEMGLGKTVQIASFVGKIVTKWKASPALIVVPNSTITNWVREFERWSPNLRVVPFYGENKAREVIKRYELFHDKPKAQSTSAKFHVLIATYESVIGTRDFTPVFKNQPRWEVLIIDEGQRLKSDSSLLFKKLNELKTAHRIIMTGTPLNNNIRELFNLMNFLDKDKWNDLEALEKEHEELTEDLVKDLHNKLRPYFLRRLKTDVLTLPPKNEVIVPMSMAPLQKEVYRSILSKNLDTLNGLLNNNGNGKGQKITKISNVLMQLRKCLQHPYLYDEEIEPRGLSATETHGKLIDASAKLRFLKTLLPKLRARGHRVLLFSQFVLALNVIEDFLVGEGIKFLRLDGNTKGAERQKGMDAFNKDGSDVFVYLLTTRAGGVGINLFSADTVIIFDPDFNPHQDLQAIARAHRFGQQKTVMVFKLMVKESAEERIMQIGRKKMVLDHLIVQKMDDEDGPGENVQSILTFGAKQLFEESNTRDLVYSDQDIDKLIQKTEEGSGEEQSGAKEGGGLFSFAKIWTADDGEPLAEVGDEEQLDSWAQTLQKMNEERAKAQEEEIALAGRGVRRKAAGALITEATFDFGDTPRKVKGKKGIKDGRSSDGSAYNGSVLDSDIEDVSDASMAGDSEYSGKISTKRRKTILTHEEPLPTEYCTLCGKTHGVGLGQCEVTDNSENLAEFREMLLSNNGEETLEERQMAIDQIDRVLHSRGHTHLILNQPLRLVIEQTPLPRKKKPQVPRPNNGTHSSASAGTSKRGSSPTPIEGSSSTKRARSVSAMETDCPVCNLSVRHELLQCPTVAKGPKEVTQAIKRLEDNPSMNGTVYALRKILVNQRRLALAGSSQNALHNA